MATNPMTDFFGEVISSYSRAEAIEDGVLVNLSGSTFHYLGEVAAIHRAQFAGSCLTIG